MDNKHRKLFVTKQSKGYKFMPKMQQNTFRSRTPPEPAGGAYALPRPPSRNGVLLLRGGCLLIRGRREQDGLLLRGMERKESIPPKVTVRYEMLF